MLRIFFLLLLIAPLSAIAQSEKEHIAAGVAKEEEGYLEAALDEYKKGLPLPRALNGIASVKVAIGDYDSVLFLLEKSRSRDSSANNLVNNFQVEGRYWQVQNENEKALSFLQRALDLAVKKNDVRSRAIILSNMGNVYFSYEHDQKIVRSFFEKSIALCDSAQHANILARNYTRLANSYFVTGEGVIAKRYFDRAKKITDISGNLPLRAYVMSTIAINLFEEKKYRECIESMQEPMRIRRELGQTRALQNDLLNISETYMMVKDYSNAHKALDEGLQISRSLKDIIYQKYFYERASALDSVSGNYKSALSNLRLSLKFKDSAFSAERLRDVKEIQEKYEAEQKEKVIAEKELAIEQNEYEINFLIGGVIIAILILAILRINSRRVENQHRLSTIVKTQEEVQQRIARDLHDGLVQTLGAAKMSLQSISSTTDKATVQKHVSRASKVLDDAIDETRSISHEILPYSLLKDGLISALEELFARNLSSFNFTHDDHINVGEDITIHVYRIAQELVNNIKKHAASAHITVSLKIDENLVLIFEDDGPGYVTDAPTKGAGLTNITTRARLMNATVVTDSTIGKGTRNQLNVPL